MVRKSGGVHAKPGEFVRAGEGAHAQVLRQSARIGAFHKLFAGLRVQGQNHLVQHTHRLETVQGRERVGGAFDAGVGGATVNPEAVAYCVFTQLADGVVEECATCASSAVFGGDGCLNHAGIFIVCRGERHEDGGEGAVILGDKETRRGQGAFAECLTQLNAGLLGERRDAVMAGNLLREGIEAFQQLFGELRFCVDRGACSGQGGGFGCLVVYHHRLLS